MRPASIAFWVLFSLAGIWLENVIPGWTFMPGFILAMQEEKCCTRSGWDWSGCSSRKATGSLAFGMGLLWYGLLAGLYFFGHWLFEARNFLFMFILGLCLGTMHFLLINVMSVLQDWVVPAQRLAMESILQTLIFPIEWGLLYLIHQHLPDNIHAA